MNLIIVESPTKARTLSRFLGSEYSIEATMGHVKDLPKSKLGIDVEHNFEPQYIEVEDKKAAVGKIVKKANSADNVYLATDPDREGEAIALHIKQLMDKGSGKKKYARIVFHEITQHAVEEAIANPKAVNIDLVDAQVARRVLDRLVGYKLSPLLWKKVRRGLSAGRVQSVALKLIVEREKEIIAFKQVEFWEIYCDLETNEKKVFRAQLVKVEGKRADVGNKGEAISIEKALKTAKYSVLDVKKREIRKNPYPPFTTSTMTQAAARIYKWSSKKTMSVAQKLYEEGLITYHRTDSTNIASIAITNVRDFIDRNFNKSYLPPNARFYKTKSKVAQEAHEAIRPTDVNLVVDGKWPISGKFASDTEKLYALVWKRFVASQMESSVYDETVIEVLGKSDNEYLLKTSGQVMKFDGWRKVLGKAVEEEMVFLPDAKKGDPLDLKDIITEQKFTQPPARFNEASLIKTLEQLGIGRPSTYAMIISTIIARSYVEKDEGKFTPTPVGSAVSDFLTNNFPKLFDYGFTAHMEDDLDEIANGKLKWARVISDFYKPFESRLGTVEEKAKRVKIEVEKLNKKCPDCKDGELVIRIGRFGKFISCSNFPECKHTEKFIEKMEKMSCPKCKKGDVVIKRTKKGRKFYGCSRYPKCDWASWRKPIKEKKG